VELQETQRLLERLAPGAVQARLRRTLEAAGNRTRHGVLPLAVLARLGGASERAALYRTHGTALAEQAVAGLADRGWLQADAVSTVVFVSGTGWSAPSLDTHVVRRFGLDPSCRRLSLTQLGCGGGVAALALAAEIVRRDPRERVLVVSVELPSLQLQLGEPSYVELVSASQFGDGAAAAIVSSDGPGPEILATRSVLLPEVEEGGRIVPGETGLRLIASSGLPRLIRERVRGLVDTFVRDHGEEPERLGFVLGHPRNGAVLDAIADGLGVAGTTMAASRAVWESCGNMVSASIYRALAQAARVDPPAPDALGLLIAFGTGVACEMALVRWRSAPDAVCV
jgi:alkylresorcinol/alkylpyrone synthase